jgi:hypothetical protein
MLGKNAVSLCVKECCCVCVCCVRTSRCLRQRPPQGWLRRDIVNAGEELAITGLLEVGSAHGIAR